MHSPHLYFNNIMAYMHRQSASWKRFICAAIINTHGKKKRCINQRGKNTLHGKRLYGVRGSSRHDDSPRVGASLGRLTHASTTSHRPRLQLFASTLHNCRSVYSFIVTCAYVGYISFGIVHCMHLVPTLTTLYTTQRISTFFYSEVIKRNKPG